MITFCNTCDNPLQGNATFCSKCGAPVADAPTPSADHLTVAEEPIALPIAGPAESPSYAEAAVTPPPPVEEAVFEDGHAEGGRNWLLIGGALGTLLVIGLLYFFLFVADDISSTDSSEPVAAAASGGAMVEAQKLYTMTEANIRDKATTKGSTILGKLPRGSTVSGKQVPGTDDPTGQWLELTDGKGFISMVNLTDTQPPEITKALNDKIWTADTAIEIWKQPDSSSELLDRASEGTKLTLSGLTANDYIEIKPKAGGVGYVAGGAAILSRVGGKPVDLAFNVATCGFGSELEIAFQRLGSKVRAEWDDLEQRDFPSDEAREAALSKAEGRSRFERLQRSWNGLTITAIGQHYESQSLYFSDPPAKVIDVFRQKGFKIDGEGNFPAAEMSAGIYSASGEAAAYGKTDLGCGV